MCDIPTVMALFQSSGADPGGMNRVTCHPLHLILMIFIWRKIDKKKGSFYV